MNGCILKWLTWTNIYFSVKVQQQLFIYSLTVERLLGRFYFHSCLFPLILSFHGVPDFCSYGCHDSRLVVAQNLLQVVLYQHVSGCEKSRLESCSHQFFYWLLTKTAKSQIVSHLQNQTGGSRRGFCVARGGRAGDSAELAGDWILALHRHISFHFPIAQWWTQYQLWTLDLQEIYKKWL